MFGLTEEGTFVPEVNGSQHTIFSEGRVTLLLDVKAKTKEAGLDCYWCEPHLGSEESPPMCYTLLTWGGGVEGKTSIVDAKLRNGTLKLV